MARETQKFTTSGGHVVEIKSYLIGREKRALTNIVFKNGGVTIDPMTQKVQGLNQAVMEDLENLAWKTVIVSIDGHTEGETVDGKPFSIVETILDMKASDYAEVVAKVNEITQDKPFEEKKTI